jgi:hypothetical protein
VQLPGSCGGSVAVNAAGAQAAAGFSNGSISVQACTSADGQAWSGPVTLAQGVSPAVAIARTGGPSPCGKAARAPRQAVLRAETRRGQDPQGSVAVPQAAAIRPGVLPAQHRPAGHNQNVRITYDPAADAVYIHLTAACSRWAVPRSRPPRRPAPAGSSHSTGKTAASGAPVDRQVAGGGAQQACYGRGGSCCSVQVLPSGSLRASGLDRRRDVPAGTGAHKRTAVSGQASTGG